MGRKAILTAIDTQLANITIVNGYNNTLKKHYDGFIDYQKLPGDAFPSTCIATGGSNYVPMTAEKYTSGDSIQANDGWIVATIGYIKADTQDLISTKIELLVSDMIKAILADHHLGLASYVHNITLKSINPYLDLKVNIGIVEITWAVKYDFEKGSP